MAVDTVNQGARSPEGWRPRHLVAAVNRGVRARLASTGSVVTTAGSVALTFDDGPDPAVTGGVLDALAAAKVTATFFMLAGRAEAQPALVVRALAEGHEIGLHGAEHVALREVPFTEVVRCIRQGRRRLERVSGAPVRLFRPPFGRQDLRSYLVARASGLDVVAWNVQVDDWLDQAPTEMAGRLREQIAPGAFVLLHDGLVRDPRASDPPPRFDRVAMIEGLLGVLEESGLQGVTVSQLLTMGAPVRFPWFG